MTTNEQRALAFIQTLNDEWESDEERDEYVRILTGQLDEAEKRGAAEWQPHAQTNAEALAILAQRYQAALAVVEAARGINRDTTDCGRCMVIHEALSAYDALTAKEPK